MATYVSAVAIKGSIWNPKSQNENMSQALLQSQLSRCDCFGGRDGRAFSIPFGRSPSSAGVRCQRSQA